VADSRHGAYDPLQSLTPTRKRSSHLNVGDFSKGLISCRVDYLGTANVPHSSPKFDRQRTVTERAPAARKTKITTHDEIIPEDKMRESLLVESFTNLDKSVLDDHLLITHHIVTALPSREQQIV
jgi:hypothetical protein